MLGEFRLPFAWAADIGRGLYDRLYALAVAALASSWAGPDMNLAAASAIAQSIVAGGSRSTVPRRRTDTGYGREQPSRLEEPSRC